MERIVTEAVEQTSTGRPARPVMRIEKVSVLADKTVIETTGAIYTIHNDAAEEAGNPHRLLAERRRRYAGCGLQCQWRGRTGHPLLQEGRIGQGHHLERENRRGRKGESVRQRPSPRYTASAGWVYA